MPNPFIDPLDTAPVTSRQTGGKPQTNPTPKPSTQTEPFQEILRKKVEKEPTPILKPSALNVPDLPISKKGIAPAANQPVQSKLETPQTQTSKQTDPTNNFEHQAKQTANSSAKTETSQTTQSSSPKNLRELMAAITQGETETKTDETPVVQPERAAEPVQKEPSTPLSTYRVQRGDTLSEIVARAMRENNIQYNTSDIYRMVRVVANANGIQNPNLIYAGQRLDLSPIRTAPLETQLASRQSPISMNAYQVPVHGNLTSPYGMREHPILGVEMFHQGIDIAVPIGTPIQPVKEGTVSFAGQDGGYGQMIDIDHGDGTSSRYGHLSSLLVSEGETIQPNQTIGLSGETGLSTGPHLHLEIHENGRPVDPLQHISREQIESLDEGNASRIARREEPV